VPVGVLLGWCGEKQHRSLGNPTPGAARWPEAHASRFALRTLSSMLGRYTLAARWARV
jgi:hypothetical protein